MIVYVGSTCDEWKTWRSMHMEIATTSKKRLKEWLQTLIDHNDIYVADDMMLRHLFKAKLPPCSFCDELNSILGYVYLEARDD